MSRLTGGTWSLTWTACVAALALAAAAAAQDTGGDAVERAKHLVVMIGGQLGEGETFGAGIIAGTGPDRLYVATANHVVRQGSRVAERLRVQFRSLPGESFDARLLDHFDPALDLAVLVVSEVGRHNIPLDRIPFERLGAPEALKRGDPVYPLGNPGGRSWYSRVNPDAMSAAVTGDRLVFEAPFLARGHSGGGLFTERWELVGMIQADEPPEGRALSVTRMIAALRGWGYPVNLAAPKTAESRPAPTTTSAPRTPVVRAPEPAPAPSRAEGRICPTLSGGDGGETILVAGLGKRLEVGSGQCVGVEPGRYTVAVDEADAPLDRDCRTVTVDLAAGETSRPSVTCFEVAAESDVSGAWSLTMAGQLVSRMEFVKVDASRYRYTEVSLLGPVGQGTATLERSRLKLEGMSLGVPIAGEFDIKEDVMTGFVEGPSGILPAALSR